MKTPSVGEMASMGEGISAASGGEMSESLIRWDVRRVYSQIRAVRRIFPSHTQSRKKPTRNRNRPAFVSGVRLQPAPGHGTKAPEQPTSPEKEPPHRAAVSRKFPTARLCVNAGHRIW